MVILSVDYGDTRTGIAVCDKLQILASPVCVINEHDQSVLVNKIIELVLEHKAERIVVGLPKNMDDSEGERSEKCRELAACLHESSGIEVVLQDERLTTVEAIEYLNRLNIRGKKRKNIIDAVSAVIILQDYLTVFNCF